MGKYMDEVLVAIAYNLGRCVEFIGPMSELPCLLKPLEWMCNIEETTVRDEAVASLNLIGKSMESEQIKAEFLPIVLSLAKHMEWFTPRVSACGLFALAMQKLSGDVAASKELREGFKQLGTDETPMVRRAAALQLSDFAKALGDALTTEDLLPLYQTLLSDEQDSVRVNALKSTPAVCKLIGSLRKEVLKDNFKKCVGDKSWRVRVACAESIAEVGEGCEGDAEALAELKDIYCMLQRDHEAEVRSTHVSCSRARKCVSSYVRDQRQHAAGGALQCTSHHVYTHTLSSILLVAYS
jgi:serine/threonine-protein phosphatase 2A regulatory subunit A